MQLTEPVVVSLNKPGTNMWDRVLTAFVELLGKVEEGYTTKATCSSISLLLETESKPHIEKIHRTLLHV